MDGNALVRIPTQIFHCSIEVGSSGTCYRINYIVDSKCDLYPPISIIRIKCVDSVAELTWGEPDKRSQCYLISFETYIVTKLVWKTLCFAYCTRHFQTSELNAADEASSVANTQLLGKLISPPVSIGSHLRLSPCAK